MFAYYSAAFGSGGQLFSRVLCKKAATEIMKMLFVCFVRAAEFGVTDLFLPSMFQALGSERHLRANEGILIPFSRKINSKTMKQGLLTMISGREADQASALLALA